MGASAAMLKAGSAAAAPLRVKALIFLLLANEIVFCKFYFFLNRKSLKDTPSRKPESPPCCGVLRVQLQLNREQT